MKKILLAEIISFFFHPVLFFFFMPFLIVYHTSQSEAYALKWQLFSSLFIFVGILIYLWGRWKGIYSDFDLSKKDERAKFYSRIWPLALLYVVVAVFFKGIFFPMSIIALGLFISLIIFTAINRYTKASIHVAVSSAYATTVGIMYGPLAFFLTSLIVPCVIWSRIVLKRHIISETIVGAILGIGIPLVMLVITRYLQFFL